MLTAATLGRWNAPLECALEAAEREPRHAQPMWFRFGDAFLEVVSAYEPLLGDLTAFYGDCASAEPPPDGVRLRCTARLVPQGPFLSLTFSGPRQPDLIEVARSPYRASRREPYVEVTSPGPGWRVLVNRDAHDRLLIATNDRGCLINLDEAPPEFVVDLVVCAAQSVQTDVLFLHAGSVGIAGSGVLIIAPSNGGKSTTTLALAQRGHAFLGDDVAVVRLATRELLPFPRSAGLRDGSLARSLDGLVQRCRHLRSKRHGTERTVVRVSDLFPWSVSGPLPLRFAFVLGGLAESATISEFRPGLEELPRLHAVATDASASWGLSPGRDLMLFLRVVNLLSELRCHLVQRGTPDETARVIEAVIMEGA